MAENSIMRRRIVQIGAAGIGGALLAGSAGAAVPEVDTGKVQGGRAEFPPEVATTERPSGGPPNPMPVNDRVGFAVVGGGGGGGGEVGGGGAARIWRNQEVPPGRTGERHAR